MRARSFVSAGLVSAGLVAGVVVLATTANAIPPLIVAGAAAAWTGIKAVTAGLVAWQAAQELGATYAGPSKDDPASIEAAAARVRAMRGGATPASNDDIARWVSGVVDRKLAAENRWYLPGEGGMQLVDRVFGTDKNERLERWRNLRENKALDRVHPSDAERIAALAWETGIGNCNESAALSRAILKRAGIDARILQSSAGHDFAVIGLAPGAEPNDPNTWGPDARVVDGWTGRSYTPEEATRSSVHHGGGWGGGKKRVVVDLTNTYDDPGQQQRYEALAGKAVLRVFVRRARDGARVSGASITVSGAHSAASVTDASGVAHVGVVPMGSYTLAVSPPAGAGLRPGGGTLMLAERDDTRHPVDLADEVDGGDADGGGAGALDAGAKGADAGTTDAGARGGANARDGSADLSGAAGRDAGSRDEDEEPTAKPPRKPSPPRGVQGDTRRAGGADSEARFQALRAEHRRLHALCIGGDNAACSRRKRVYDEAKRVQQQMGK